MENDNTQNEIMRSLGRIEGEIKGVNKRLDILNGSNVVRDKRINKNESKIDMLTGKALGAGAGAGAVVGCIAVLISYLK